MSKGVVLQSQDPRRMPDWQRRCCDSVRSWAAAQGLAYRWEGNEVFARLAPRLRRRFTDQPVVLADLARLLWLREVLAEGFASAIWIDVDVLIFAQFAPRAHADTFGREVWVQRDRGRLRSYRKIHNAWLAFNSGSSTLDFYIDRAHSLLERVTPPVVPQFIGPKLLTAWHNLVPFEVEERVGMLSPLVAGELLGTAGDGLERLRQGHAEVLHALNLCASLQGRPCDGVCLDTEDYHRLIDTLLDGGLPVSAAKT